MARNAAPSKAIPQEPELEAQRCLQAAEQFLKASRRAIETRLATPTTFDPAAHIPAVVCAAFTVELSFKALLLIEQRRRWAGHQLAQLFAELSPSSQQAIEDAAKGSSYFDGRGRTMFFREALDAINSVFEDWRYIYERSDDLAVDVTFLHRLADAALAAARARLPAPV